MIKLFPGNLIASQSKVQEYLFKKQNIWHKQNEIPISGTK